MTKRINIPTAKPGELKAAWGRTDRGENPSVCYCWGGDGASKPDGRILAHALEQVPIFEGKTLIKELEERGYDITTLKFSVQMKKETE